MTFTHFLMHMSGALVFILG